MKRNFFYGYIIIFILFIIQVAMIVPRGSFGVFINPITSEFNWTRALISGAFSLASIVQGFSGIVMGRLNDRLGPRVVFVICGLLLGGGLMLMSFVDSAWKLYLFYVVPIGIGMGGVSAPQSSTAARWFIKRRNLMTGIIMSGKGVGGLIGPLLATWIIYTYSWREAFLFIGIGVFILIILAAQFLKRDPFKIGQLPYGDGNINVGKISAVVDGTTFRQAFFTRRFWIFASIIFCVGLCITTILVHIVPYAIDRGISPTSAAIVLSAINVAMTLGSIAVGLIADKIGCRNALIVCICLLSTVILLILPITSFELLGFLTLILAFGSGGIAILDSSMVAELFGMKSHGTILGCIIFCFTLGGALGTFLGGSIFDATGSYQWVFLLCGTLVVAAIIMAIYLSRIRKPVAVM